MLDLLKVATRNVKRNFRRTLITALTVFIGVVVAISTRGLLNGLQEEIRSNLTRKLHGDLQIHRQGYQDSLESSPYKLLIPEQPPLGPYESAPRLKIMGLLNHQKSQNTAPVVISGINSYAEAKVCPRFQLAVQKGRMLDSNLERLAAQVEDADLGEARGLAAGHEASGHEQPLARGYHQLMISPSLQRGLGAEIGDELVVMLSDRDNMQQALVVELVGIVDVATPGAASRMAWMDLTTLQKTLNVTGLASEIALRLPERGSDEVALRILRAELPRDQIVETWLQLGGPLTDAMKLQEIVFSAIVFILFVIVIAAIVNTSLMTVMERTREIGTLMALGYRRHHIMLLFLTEAGTIGSIGGIAGVLFGSGLVTVLGLRGITMTLPGAAIPTELYPNISPAFLLMSLTVAVTAALISGLIPAYRASHLKPVAALSSN